MAVLFYSSTTYLRTPLEPYLFFSACSIGPKGETPKLDQDCQFRRSRTSLGFETNVVRQLYVTGQGFLMLQVDSSVCEVTATQPVAQSLLMERGGSEPL